MKKARKQYRQWKKTNFVGSFRAFIRIGGAAEVTSPKLARIRKGA